MKRRSVLALFVLVLAAVFGVWYLRQSTASREPETTGVSIPQPPPSMPGATAVDRTPTKAQDPARRQAPDDVESNVAAEARLVLQALQERNMAELAKHVHPLKGLRFSPYIAIDPKRSVVLKTAELPGALEDSRRRTWGSDDGSGDPISGTFASYYERFVYDRDYLSAAQIRLNQFGDKSTTRPNIREVYPNSIVVEAHVPGTKPESEGMDWSSLLMVFEQHESHWYLSALVHDQWTI